jgi:hypothetical protein
MDRRESLCKLAEEAMSKPVPRDVDAGQSEEDSSQFAIAEVTETPEEAN